MKNSTKNLLLLFCVTLVMMTIGCGSSDKVATAPSKSDECLTPGNCQVGGTYSVGAYLATINANAHDQDNYTVINPLKMSFFAEESVSGDFVSYHGAVTSEATLTLLNNRCGIAPGDYRLQTVQQGEWDSYLDGFSSESKAKIKNLKMHSIFGSNDIEVVFNELNIIPSQSRVLSSDAYLHLVGNTSCHVHINLNNLTTGSNSSTVGPFPTGPSGTIDFGNGPVQGTYWGE